MSELAVMVFEECEDAEGLCIVRVLSCFVEGRSSQSMCLPRSYDAVSVRCRGSITSMFMGLDEVRVLHVAALQVSGLFAC